MGGFQFAPAPGEVERDHHAGLWVAVDCDPRLRDLGVNLRVAEVVRRIDPATMHGLDRLRFLSGAHGGGDERLVLEHDSVPVTVEVDAEGVPFVLLGGDERLRLPVYPAHWVEGEDALAARERLAHQVQERHKRAQRLRDQAAVRDVQGLMTLPSESGQVLGMPMTRSGTRTARRARLKERMKLELTRSPPSIDGTTRVTGAMVTVELDPKTRSGLQRQGKRKRAELQLALPFDSVNGRVDELPELAWRVLQWLDTDALLTLLAGMHHAIRGDGTFAASASVVGRERGLIGGDGRLDKSKRHELEAQLEMLQQVNLKVTPYGREHQDTLPLLVRVGTRKVRGKGEVPLLAVQPQLMHRMMKGRALVVDRRVLGFRPDREEWHLRIYWWFSSRWSLGWVGQKLHRGDGMVTVKLTDLLDQAGLQWRDLVRTRGQQEVLRRVRSALRDLEQHRGGPMLHGVVEEGDTLEDTVVKARPSVVLAGQLTTTRSGTIAHLQKVEPKVPGKPRRRPGRGRAGGAAARRPA